MARLSEFEYDRKSEILYHLTRGPIIVALSDVAEYFHGSGWLTNLNAALNKHVAFEIVAPLSREPQTLRAMRVRLEIAHAPGDPAWQTENDMKHQCHAVGCALEVPPKMHMCLTHWRMVPKAVQDLIWAHYRNGQEIDKQLSIEYIATAFVSISCVALREGKRLPTLDEGRLLFMTCACTTNALCRACRDAYALKAIAIAMRGRGEPEIAKDLFAIHTKIEQQLRQSYRERERTAQAYLATLGK